MLHRVAASVAVACVLAGCTYTEGGPQAPPSPTAPAAVGPALGAPGYPTRLYPASVAGRSSGPLPACPAVTGLRPPPSGQASGFRAQAVRIVNGLYRRSLASDLHHTDRTMWLQVIAMWRGGDAPLRGAVDRADFPVLLTGPVTPGAGNPEVFSWVRQSCAPAVLRASYLVVSGPPEGPSLQTDFVFVDRRGRPLLFFVY